MADKFFVEKKKEKSTGKVYAKHNFAWFLGCLVLLLIAVTFVLPATGLGAFATDSYSFGSYDGEKVEYSENSLMYQLTENYKQQYSMFLGGNGNFLNQICMQNAYNDVIYILGCISNAKKSGAHISREEVDDFLIREYKDSNGNFAIDSWRAIGDGERKRIRNLAERDLYKDIYTSAFDSVEAKNDKNISFAKGFIPNSKDFSALVFIGEDANEKANEALSKVKSGITLEDCAKEYEKTVANIQNVFEKDFKLVDNSSQSGDIGKFYEALGANPDLRNELFSLKKDELYKDVVSLNDNEKLIIVALGDTSEDSKKSNEDRIAQAFDVSYESFVRDSILNSSLHKNNFSKTYDKYFRTND